MERMAEAMVVLSGGNDASGREGVGLCSRVLRRTASGAW